MNRNNENHFALAPRIDMQRSTFKRPHGHKTTFNTGDLIPFYLDMDVLPGDTVSLDTAAAIRMSTPIFPVMDNCYVDSYFFFVPNRLVWEHWEEFLGENKLTAWEQPVDYEIPQITAPEGGWAKGTIADYMGVPTEVEGLSINALPFRGLAMIWNEWFRDQNLKDACMVNTDDATQVGSNSGDYVINTQLGALPPKVARYHDYFTSALPEPQKGPDVLLPLGNEAPIIAANWGTVSGLNENTSNIGEKAVFTNRTGISSIGTITTGETQGYRGISGENTYYGLAADLTNATAATINNLRQAFAVQRFYERQAIGGSRYREIIKSFFGVTSPDARMQIPEYLGGARHVINMDQVIQMSETTETSPQGNTAAYSLTNFVENSFTKSFTEHGMIIGLLCVRTDQTWQQGLERGWSRRTKFDYYWPTFANIGEQAVKNKEIFAQGTDEDDEVFGYQEAWADYRYKPSRVSGAFRSNYAQSLDSWHYANYFTELPRLSSEFIDETRANVNRTIAVQDELEDQFIADFYFNQTWVRPMPLYSVPGLIDHH